MPQLRHVETEIVQTVNANGRHTHFDERLAAVERLYLEELMKSSDANEGLAAFKEKRKPAWSGR